MKTQTVEYKQDSTILEGYLAYDETLTGKRPGVLIAHEWKGLNDYIRMRTDMVAKLGYVALAADVYGKGVRPQTVEQAAAEMNKYSNHRPLLRQRALAGLAALESQPNVDATKVAAMGYCFGGTTVLELARAGANVKGVVSFHGGLGTPAPQDAKNIKARLLILHGANDPFVPPSEVTAFETEMKNARVNYQLIQYPGAVHGFTNPTQTGQLQGALYNKAADEQSWQDMQKFFKEIFN
ncbi:MAG: dienelactone hydrolase family protein [Candidatus Omnitrophica bacterium]|nr:dienelactone hydrolase family protein [Candidatus Omnitrophota bacterium]